MSVVPDIVPEIVRLPAEVVTVQSPACAAGLDSVAFTHLCVASMLLSVIVVGSDDTLDFDTVTTPIYLPMKLSNEDKVFIHSPFYDGAVHPSAVNSVLTDESMSVSTLSALPDMS